MPLHSPPSGPCCHSCPHPWQVKVGLPSPGGGEGLLVKPETRHLGQALPCMTGLWGRAPFLRFALSDTPRRCSHSTGE